MIDDMAAQYKDRQEVAESEITLKVQGNVQFIMVLGTGDTDGKVSISRQKVGKSPIVVPGDDRE